MKPIVERNAGITLMVLVVTIIVLIILAGVTISMISGENGILNKSIEAKKETKRSQALEEAEIAYRSSEMENLDENTILNKAVEKLKNQGYKIESISSNNMIIKNVKFILNNTHIQEVEVQNGEMEEIELSIEKVQSKDIQHYIQINDKYYLLTMNTTEISIGDKEIDISKINSAPDENIVEVISNNNSIATVNLNDEKTNMTITGIAIGETAIITKTNLGKTTTLKVNVIEKQKQPSILYYYDRSLDDSGKNERASIKYREGMTWEEWINSEYNENSWTIDGDKIVSSSSLQISYTDSIRETSIVTASEVMQNNYGYIVYGHNMYKISLKEGEKIAIANDMEMPSKMQSIIYKEGMTWEEWIDSEYNNDGWTVTGNNIRPSFSGSPGAGTVNLVDKSETIQEGIYVIIMRLLHKY